MNGSRNMPNPETVCKSSIIYTERRGANYGELDEVNIYIPPSLAIINCKSSYISLRFKVADDALLKLSPSGVAGIYGCFRDVTISSGDGQTVLEQLDQYGLMDGLRQFYSENESLRNLRVLHEGKPSSIVIGDTTGNQYCDATSQDGGSAFKTVECLLPLHLSGCLSPDRDTVFPNLATQGLRIRINLQEAQSALCALTAPVYKAGVDGDEVEISYQGCQRKGGGGYSSSYGYEVQTAIVGGAGATIILQRRGDDLKYDNHIQSADVANPAHLFMNGQTITILDNPGTGVGTEDKVISGIAVDAGNRIVLTCSANVANAYAIGATVHIKVDSTTVPSVQNYEMTDVRMMVDYVIPPQGYMESVLSQVNKGLQMDIRSYTNYGVNISSNSLTNSLYINARNTRGKAILSVPIHSSQATYVEDSLVPDRNTVKNYQFILHKILCPDQLVNMNRYNLNSYNAVALREQQHALAAGDIPVNNILKNFKHFFIGRRLALPGYSYNMNREGEVRLNLNYNQTAALLLNNFVVHLRRIIIRPEGIQVIQ
jgi:hypothetical protein